MTLHSSSRWIAVDSEKYDVESSEDRSGVAFQMYLSPYDLPEAIRGRYEEARRRFLIDFRYINEEPTELEKLDDYVGLFVGKKSGRVHQIEIDVDAMGVSQVILELNKALSRLEHRLPDQDRLHANYEVASKVVRDHEQELLQVIP